MPSAMYIEFKHKQTLQNALQCFKKAGRLVPFKTSNILRKVSGTPLSIKEFFFHQQHLEEISLLPLKV